MPGPASLWLPDNREALDQQENARDQGQATQYPAGKREAKDDVEAENNEEDCEEDMGHGIEGLVAPRTDPLMVIWLPGFPARSVWVA
jgi:hypothetical protein